jgi:hypothetical protein
MRSARRGLVATFVCFEAMYPSCPPARAGWPALLANVSNELVCVGRAARMHIDMAAAGRRAAALARPGHHDGDFGDRRPASTRVTATNLTPVVIEATYDLGHRHLVSAQWRRRCVVRSSDVLA